MLVFAMFLQNIVIIYAVQQFLDLEDTAAT